MRNYKNNKRRFRNNSYDKNFKINSNDQGLSSSFGNVSDFKKKSFNRNNFNSTKLIQKYSDLAREALSVGDKILYENYMQHAEHFIRISENFQNNQSIKNGSSDAVKDANISKINKEDIKQDDQIQIKES
tara:strand:- start:1489 stop:1878 length:390 start_codon:yes stop_codon:yes gene_type:complete